MGNYNPRQNTMMRFKDERELEKFKFISAEFDFNYETIENASKNYPYNLLVNEIKKIKNITRPCLIYDITQNRTFVGYITSYSINLTTQYSNKILEVSMTYDESPDQLNIFTAEEEVISADNVKTFFGNQSIIGPGNIDLYRHEIIVNGLYHGIIYSSNNLKIDSLQDLTTVVKPYNNMIIPIVDAEITGSAPDDTFINIFGALIYNNNIWKAGITASSSPLTISSISDIVTTI